MVRFLRWILAFARMTDKATVEANETKGMSYNTHNMRIYSQKKADIIDKSLNCAIVLGCSARTCTSSRQPKNDRQKERTMNKSRRLSDTLTLINTYDIEDRTGKTLGDILGEYDSFETSYLSMRMHDTGTSEETPVTGRIRTMKIVRIRAELTSTQLYETFRKLHLRPVNWVGVLIFGAQHPKRALRHMPVALGGKPDISKIHRGEHRNVPFYAQVRPEHNGYYRKDLTIQVACADPKTGRWEAGTCFLVTDIT